LHFNNRRLTSILQPLPETGSGRYDRATRSFHNTGRYRIAVWHGEGKTMFYVVDGQAAAEYQPCVIETFTARNEAEAYALKLQA
jgi:hypothetical protein